MHFHFNDFEVLDDKNHVQKMLKKHFSTKKTQQRLNFVN